MCNLLAEDWGLGSFLEGVGLSDKMDVFVRDPSTKISPKKGNRATNKLLQIILPASTLCSA
jgi:hypothetical protein